jgi:hypothetical protein
MIIGELYKFCFRVADFARFFQRGMRKIGIQPLCEYGYLALGIPEYGEARG